MQSRVLQSELIAARREVDARRRPHMLDVDQAQRHAENIAAFARALPEQNAEKRIKIICDRFRDVVDSGMKSVVESLAKCRTEREYAEFLHMYGMMLQQIRDVQTSRKSMADASDAVFACIEEKYVKL
jgi:hypothetical protein